mmetsp:Transcript_3234/g.7640  ORF Transcript_3234/g.7640 Transcript_3234/m.7640 type:complete len:345 (-) Transcript_3234:2-1036(-)
MPSKLANDMARSEKPGFTGWLDSPELRKSAGSLEAIGTGKSSSLPAADLPHLLWPSAGGAADFALTLSLARLSAITYPGSEAHVACLIFGSSVGGGGGRCVLSTGWPVLSSFGVACPGVHCERQDDLPDKREPRDVAADSSPAVVGLDEDDAKSSRDDPRRNEAGLARGSGSSCAPLSSSSTSSANACPVASLSKLLAGKGGSKPFTSNSGMCSSVSSAGNCSGGFRSSESAAATVFRGSMANSGTSSLLRVGWVDLLTDSMVLLFPLSAVGGVPRASMAVSVGPIATRVWYLDLFPTCGKRQRASHFNPSDFSLVTDGSKRFPSSASGIRSTLIPFGVAKSKA